MGLGIGPLELGMVLLVALLVFGPHRLPELTRTVGRSMAEFRRAIGQVTVDLAGERPARSPQRRRGSEREATDPSPESADPPA